MAELTFLGTGTSVGVPMLGCHCETCRSEDPRDQRMRTSALITEGKNRIVIDTSPEFRLQALRAHIDYLDAVFVTHDHADHVAGLDDLRALTIHSRKSIPVYCNSLTRESLCRRFAYIWQDKPVGTTLPLLDLRSMEGTIQVGALTVEPLTVYHGKAAILAFKIGTLGYVTDVSRIPDEAKARLAGLDTLVIEALRFKPHPTHLTIEQSLALVEELKPKQAYFIHMCHSVLYRRDSKILPESVHFAYDGLTIPFNS